MAATSPVRQLDLALDAGEGVLHLLPAWVPRTFVHPGRRLKLHPQDLYALGVNRGGIDERWLASAVQADNGPGTPHDEGMSYILCPDGEWLLLRDAVEAAGPQIIGEEIYARYRRWPVFCKFFDNMGPIPHHLHQLAKHVQPLGRESKPEAYYFPPQMNTSANNFPYTFFGLDPTTTREQVRDCLARWNAGDNRIRDLSWAVTLKPGTGWLVPAGILHAPGSFCTWEVQWASDVLSMFQNILEDRFVPWDLVVKDVPADKHHDYDYLVDMLDWEANVDTAFKEHHYVEPIPDGDTTSQGWQDRWVTYGKIDGEDLFSGKELTVQPGSACTIRDGGASGVIAVQGGGTLGVHPIASPTQIRYGEVTHDEYFITAGAAKAGVTVANTGVEPLVLLRYFGPGAGSNAPAVGDHRRAAR